MRKVKKRPATCLTHCKESLDANSIGTITVPGPPAADNGTNKKRKRAVDDDDKIDFTRIRHHEISKKMLKARGAGEATFACWSVTLATKAKRTNSQTTLSADQDPTSESYGNAGTGPKKERKKKAEAEASTEGHGSNAVEEPSRSYRLRETDHGRTEAESKQEDEIDGFD